jgi:hypothetical protein
MLWLVGRPSIGPWVIPETCMGTIWLATGSGQPSGSFWEKPALLSRKYVKIDTINKRVFIFSVMFLIIGMDEQQSPWV